MQMTRAARAHFGIQVIADIPGIAKKSAPAEHKSPLKTPAIRVSAPLEKFNWDRVREPDAGSALKKEVTRLAIPRLSIS